MKIIVEDGIVVIVMSTKEACDLDLDEFDRRLFNAVENGNETKKEV